MRDKKIKIFQVWYIQRSGDPKIKGSKDRKTKILRDPNIEKSILWDNKLGDPNINGSKNETIQKLKKIEIIKDRD